MTSALGVEAIELDDLGRHRSDVVRALVGFMVVFLPAFVVAGAEPSDAERWLFRTVNHLPRTLTSPLVGVMQAGALAAVPVAAMVAIALRRRALSRALLVSGTSAWLIAKVLAFAIRRRPPDELVDQIILRGNPVKTTVFPSTHAAVVAALAIAAMPFVGRFSRRISAIVVVLVGFSRLFVGAQFPIDVAAGWGVGLVVASVVHLIWRSPRRRPSVAFIQSVIERIGLAPLAVVPVLDQDVPTYRVETATAPVMVRVFGHDEELGWLYRLWRLVAFREVGDQMPFRSARERARQFIGVSLLAERAHVRSPRFIDLVDARTDRTAVITTPPAGDPPMTPVPEEATDQLLRSAFLELGRLHDAGVVHRGIRLAHLTVADGQLCFADLTKSEPSRDRELQRRDIAALVVELGVLTNAQRSVTAALDVFDAETVGVTIGFYQPLMVAADIRRDIDVDLLAEIRAEVSRRTGATEPRLTPPVRVAVRNLVVLVAGAVAVNVLLTQFGRARQTVSLLRAPHWPWIAVVAAASLVTYVMAAAAAIGSSPLPLRPPRTFLVQFAAAFTNRLSPAGLGGMATNVRYLERAGATRAAAAGSVALNTIAGFVVHLVALMAVAPSIGGVTRRLGDLPDYWPILVIAVAVLAAAGVVAAVRFAPNLIGVAGDVAGSIRAVLRQPGHALLLFGGSLGVTLAYAGALAASLFAFGAHPSTVDVLVVFLIASAVAAASPTPGGLGALEAALIAGFTHIGVPAAPAVAGVLCYRLVTYWAPVVPGFFSFRWLRRAGVL